MIDRACIFAGEIEVLAANSHSAKLASIAAGLAASAFQCAVDDLPWVHERWNAEEAWTQTCAARARLAHDGLASSAAIDLATVMGFLPTTLAFDAPRLRVVLPHAHLQPAAARAFYPHRDTWYGCPRAQVNVWLPLFDVDERDSFAIFPDVFGVAIDNDSHAFDYALFAKQGGFQSAGLIAAPYPKATSEGHGPPVRVRARQAEMVVFSPAHLHATTPNETTRTRFSVDVRFVDTVDHARGVGAPDVDNRSRGCALVDYQRARA